MLQPSPPLPSGASIYTDTAQGHPESMGLLDTSRVELSVSRCPEFLLEGFLLLFPGESVAGLSVMTITEHTQNDMTSWSSSVEVEREELVVHVRPACSGR